MSGDSDKQQVGAKIDQDTYEAVKERLSHGGITDEIRDLMNAIAYGEAQSEKKQAKQRLGELRDEREDIKSELKSLNADLENVNRKIERQENKLDSIRDKEGEYKGMLQMIESDYIGEGRIVFPEHKIIKEAADKANCDGEDVIADLKERNPETPDEQYERGGRHY